MLTVKRAEAEMERTHLQGVGVSRQRGALMAGMQQAILEIGFCNFGFCLNECAIARKLKAWVIRLLCDLVASGSATLLWDVAH